MPTPTGSYTRQFQFPGYAFQSAQTPVEFDHPNPFVIALPAGKAVTAWVKTDADTAECNLAASHGQTNGKYDVYWTAGGVSYRRHGVDGTIATNALTLDGGAGTDFPASATAGVVVCKQVAINCTIDGDAIEVIGIFLKCDSDSAARGCLNLKDSGNAQIEHVDLVRFDQAGGFANVYDINGGDTNVFTGNVITQGFASNSSTTAAAELYILSGEDSTP